MPRTRFKCEHKDIKRTVWIRTIQMSGIVFIVVITSINFPFIKVHVWFTTVSFKPLSNHQRKSNLSRQTKVIARKIEMFYVFNHIRISCLFSSMCVKWKLEKLRGNTLCASDVVSILHFPILSSLQWCRINSTFSNSV